MPARTNKLHYLQLIADNLERYLFSQDVFWPLSDGERGRFSLGTCLLEMRKLSASVPAGEDKALQEITQTINQTRERWRALWVRKAESEFPVRLRLWVNYLRDYREDPQDSFSSYPREVERRVILELLQQEMDCDVDTTAELIQKDQALRSWFLSGEFIWDSGFSKAFPETVFWYLYGSLRPSLREGRINP